MQKAETLLKTSPKMTALSPREATQVQEHKSGLQTWVKLIPVSKAFSLHQCFYFWSALSPKDKNQIYHIIDFNFIGFMICNIYKCASILQLYRSYKHKEFTTRLFFMFI